MRHSARWGALVLLALLVVIGIRPAHAHWADQAVAEIVVTGEEARIALTFPTGLTAFADDDRDGHISARELQGYRTYLEGFFSERIRLRGQLAGSAVAAVPGVLRLEPAAAIALPQSPAGAGRTHSTVVLIYRWPQPVKTLTIRYDLFLPGVPTASCLATVIRGTDVRTVVFTPERREAFFPLDGGLRVSQLPSFVALGIRHILSGYDHLLFLLSLLMVGGGLLPLAKVVTAFTVAHSITLSLAVLGAVAIPARWVESAIALSIVYVAAENLWRRDRALRSRWLVTFSFGLIHGLGFAAILRELAVARPNLVLSLAGFNLGVEIGQMLIVTTAWVGLQMLRRFPGESTARRWASAAAAGAGLFWFVQRAFLGG